VPAEIPLTVRGARLASEGVQPLEAKKVSEKEIYYWKKGQINIFNSSSIACRSLLNILKNNARQSAHRKSKPSKIKDTGQLYTQAIGPPGLDVQRLIKDRIQARKLGVPVPERKYFYCSGGSPTV